jgi:hypothetical protein
MNSRHLFSLIAVLFILYWWKWKSPSSADSGICGELVPGTTFGDDMVQVP